MIVDVHTHVFPPALIARRDELLGLDPTFAELYRNPRARLATADELLEAMDKTGVARTVVAGFAWRDARLCREHNDYLLRSAHDSAGRLLPFCTLPLCDPDAAHLEATFCARGGATGFGELRPESQSVSIGDPAVAEILTWAAEAYDVPLLLHTSEPVGHRYAGKEGLGLGPLYGFIDDHPQVRIIAAHWGGGLPFYSLMPEVRVALENVWFDTAAGTLLYDGRIFRLVADLVGVEHILFGSDYPLLSQAGQIAAVRVAELTDSERAGVLGGNAATLLSLDCR
jgi:predicted TIM-barrel fold metal-dependent hydrolase